MRSNQILHLAGIYIIFLPLHKLTNVKIVVIMENCVFYYQKVQLFLHKGLKEWRCCLSRDKGTIVWMKNMTTAFYPAKLKLADPAWLKDFGKEFFVQSFFMLYFRVKFCWFGCEVLTFLTKWAWFNYFHDSITHK